MTVLAVRSERVAQTQLVAAVANMDSAVDIAEDFTLPVGFGDCLITEVSVQLVSIQTVVANPELRGPWITLVSTVGVEGFSLSRWTKFNAAGALQAWAQLERPILWRMEETLQVSAQSEDTGAGDTTDLTILVKVVRLRNTGP